MLIRLRNLFYLMVAIVVMHGCKGFEHVRKSSDVNYKLTKANEYFDKKDYYHANTLYGELAPIMKSTRNYEALFYRYAYTYFYLKDYLMSSYYFKNFADYFPKSKNAEECEYMSAYSLYKYAPKYSLDQTNTVKSIETLRQFQDKYPQSERATEAGKLIGELKSKLELKQASAAQLYFNMSQYKAASVCYHSVMRNYPESVNTDKYLYMIMRSMYRYAEMSVPSKQEERYASAIEAYRELKDTYPKSAYMKDADKLYTETDNIIKKIRNEHN